MMTFLARVAAVTALGTILGPQVQTIPQAVQQVQHSIHAQLAPILSPTSIQELFDQESVEHLSVSYEAQQFAATTRKPSPVIKLPPLTRTRIVQAFPVDPRAVPSMVVSTQSS